MIDRIPGPFSVLFLAPGLPTVLQYSVFTKAAVLAFFSRFRSLVGLGYSHGSDVGGDHWFLELFVSSVSFWIYPGVADAPLIRAARPLIFLVWIAGNEEVGIEVFYF